MNHSICSSSYIRPDVIVAFNCGLYRQTGFQGSDSWAKTLPCLLQVSVNCYWSSVIKSCIVFLICSFYSSKPYEGGGPLDLNCLHSSRGSTGHETCARSEPRSVGNSSTTTEESVSEYSPVPKLCQRGRISSHLQESVHHCAQRKRK